jgi:hypothetical protein
MKIEELLYKEPADAPMQAEISELVDRAHSLDQLLSEWLAGKQRGVRLCRGVDDNDPDKLSVCVILEMNRVAVADLYFADSEILPEGSELVTISTFMSGINGPIAGIALDDEKLDAWEDSLGFEYNDFLCDCLGPWDAVVPFSLAYVFSEGGDVHITPTDERLLEDYLDEEDAIDVESLLCIDAHYRALKPVGGLIPGFGTSKYVWRSSVGLSPEV